MSPGRILAAVVAAALIAAVALRRRRLRLERTLVALAAALALAVVATGVLSELPAPERVIEDVAQALGSWTYALVGVMAYLETGAFVGLVAPGEFTVILGGVVAGQGEIEIVPLIGLVWLCAVLGDTTSFLIGRRLGRAFLERHGPRLKITPERLRQVEGYFARHGGKTIVVGRFIGLVRALAPFVAGSSRMRYGGFIPYSVIGTGLWAATFSLIGYVFWRSFDRVAEIAGRATLAFGMLVGAVVGGVYAYRRLRDPAERRRLADWLDRQGRRPALRPLAAVVRPLARRVVLPAFRAAAPPVRFARGRLTPGRLGIEFTTAVAVGAAGLYVFALYTVVIAGGREQMALDREGLSLAGDLRSSPAVDAVTALTDLAAFPVVATLVVLALAVLASRRRTAELITLAAGFVLVYAGVQLAKAGVDRPRPAGALVETSGASFPSGHAAYSTAYVALTVAARRALPGLFTRAAAIAAALGTAAVLGLTRVYLQAHYLSDVIGGWALGLGVFGACSAVALLVVHIRQNAAVPQTDSPADHE